MKRAAKVPAYVIDGLRDVLAHAEALADQRPNNHPDRIAMQKRGWGPGSIPSDDTGLARGSVVRGCCIAREHREAVALYVDTWIRSRLIGLLERVEASEVVDQAVRS